MREDAAAESDLAKAGYRDRLLTELAQNAADAAAREGVQGSLWVDVDGRTLTVANTGRPLDESGVHALTALRASNKVDADEGVTGRFGVGFSAVLSVSDEVELRSSTGSIRFSASHTLREIESRELPVPETGVPVLRLVWPSGELPSDGADSEVVLTLRPDVDAAALLSQMTREAVDLLLELPALGSIRLGEKTFRRSERVLDSGRQPLSVETPYRVGMTIHYFREVADEPRIPFEETILHVDRHLVVADKPHFLPVAPAGAYVRETLLTRLVRRLGNTDLVPLHRIDRGTAGLVLFSADPRSRRDYQDLFRKRLIEKRYEAVAPGLPELGFPLVRESRIVKAEPFFRMQEAEGAANARTRIEVLRREGTLWRYALFPVSGRKHQLRVHMAALGAPILNDPYYPEVTAQNPDDYARPLQLLARSLAFDDPLSGIGRRFESAMELNY